MDAYISFFSRWLDNELDVRAHMHVIAKEEEYIYKEIYIMLTC